MSRRGPRERPGLLNNSGMGKHCFESASTASTTRRRSGPGRTYLAQIDVSLRAVGRETLTRLGNSRATTAVTLLLLLYSGPPARTKVLSPILCSLIGHRLVQTACLVSPLLGVSTRLLSPPRPASPVPLPLEHGWGTQCILLLRGCQGVAGHTAQSSQDLHASRILSMYISSARGIGPCHLSSSMGRLSLLAASSNVAWPSAMLSCTAGQG